MELLQIGTVLKPQGISGQLKLSDYTDGPASLSQIKTVYIDNAEYKVMSIKFTLGAIMLNLKGVADRNQAELFRGKDVFCDKKELITDPDSYFIADIVGCSLYLTSGKLIGKVVDVTKSNVDILKIDSAEGTVYIPFLKSLEPVVDLALKKLTVNAAKFTEVCLYE